MFFFLHVFIWDLSHPTSVPDDVWNTYFLAQIRSTRDSRVNATHLVKCTAASPMCLSSLVACEKDPIMCQKRAMGVRGASDCVDTTQHSGPRTQRPLAAKGMDLFRVHCDHTKGIILGNLKHYEALVKL